MGELLPLLYILTGGFLVSFGAWALSKIIGLNVPSEEEIQEIVREEISRPFEELDEKLGFIDEDEDD